MSAPVFVDTNVLLYAADTAAEAKHRAASLWRAELWRSRRGRVSFQVLQEFYVQSTRASRTDAISHGQAAGLVEAWCRFPVQVMSVEVMRAALATRSRFGISYWDAAIIEAGRALGCSVVLSEDLDDATDYDGIRVEDPFRLAA